MINGLVWLCLPLTFGFFCMWRIAEYELKRCKQSHNAFYKEMIKIKKKLERIERNK
jgi:hypothetical protein